MTISKVGTIPEYSVWAGMIQRCTNPKDKFFAIYGGKGIKVCQRWRTSFRSFFKDMGPRPSPQHSIDRINNNGNYEPGNCRWATTREQARNRSDNRLYTHNGETLCLTDWAARLKIKVGTLDSRLKRGWSFEKAISIKTRVVTQNRTLTHNGETKTLHEWSRITGLSYALISWRISKGLPTKEILNPKKQTRSDMGKKGGKNRWPNPKKVTIRGETKTITEWAKILGIPYSVLLHRVKTGKKGKALESTKVMTFSEAGRIGLRRRWGKKK